MITYIRKIWDPDKEGPIEVTILAAKYGSTRIYDGKLMTVIDSDRRYSIGVRRWRHKETGDIVWSEYDISDYGYERIGGGGCWFYNACWDLHGMYRDPKPAESIHTVDVRLYHKRSNKVIHATLSYDKDGAVVVTKQP